MLLFRSEEEIDRWCAAREQPRGAVLPVDRLARLAVDWYGDRLDPDWQPRSVTESQAILERHGLRGAFWRLEG